MSYANNFIEIEFFFKGTILYK